MKSLRILFIGLYTSLLIGSPYALADDTEIYISASTVNSDRTNVLLGIDTSASMASHVINSANDYNANRNYQQLTPQELAAGVSMTMRRTDGNNHTFNCNANQIYVIPWTRVGLVPYQHLIGLTGNINNERYIRANNGNTRAYMGCDGDLQNRFGFIDRVVGLNNNQVACPAALQAVQTNGYFFDPDGRCDGFNVPVDTTNDGNDQASYADNMFISGNFLAYAYRCVELKDNFACDTNQLGEFITNRLDLTKEVVGDIIQNDAGYEINIGVMRFNANLTHTSRPIENYNSNPTSNFPASGGTPLENTYYEMYRYFRDQKSENTPIQNACQKNMIIYLTDGTPSSNDTGENSRIRSLTGSTCSGAGECIPALAAYMNTNDLSNLPNYNDADGTARLQTVQTHTIGFFDTDRGDFAKPIRIMRAAAQNGGGSFAQVSDTSSVRAAFTSAIENVLDEASNFTAPALTVNNYNRLTNKDDLYFSLFLPKSEPLWPGNIKKYKLQNGAIVDSASVPAIVNSTGQFNENAISYWTEGNEPDGNDITLGGFASRLSVNRNIYSDISNNNNLSNNANHINDSTVDENDLGVTSADAPAIIDWLQGLDEDGNAIKSIGDTLHTTPTVLSYRNSIASEPVDSLFFGTNSGFLHAINAGDETVGDLEHFAFYPSELLPRAQNFYNNKNENKLYGIDGPLSTWIENDNGNGLIDTYRAETAHLFATMRRGGKSIYSLNVTDVATPQLNWKITSGDTNFEELGQTWSNATPAVIAYGNEKKDVLIFGGGYDTNQDDVPDTDGDGNTNNDPDDQDVRRFDNQGRAVYIVDSKTGALLWAATAESNSANTGNVTEFSDMNYSIPSDVTVLDVNGDGLSDRLYVGDMGGQIWRFDISANTSTFDVSGGVIADMSKDGSEAENRRFYYAPNVARVSDDAFGSYLSIAIGSGKRANPKSSYTNDKFYMIRDPYVFSPKLDASGNADYNYTSSGNEILDGDLTDITNIPNPTADQIGAFGWLIDFTDTGEKVLAAAFTADNKVFFTTYLPAGNTALSCDPSVAIGGGRLYAVSLFNGRAIVKPNPSDSTDISDTITEDLENLTPQDRFADLVTPGIASTPQLFISDNSRDDNADADNDGIANIIDVDFTGGIDLNKDGIDDALQAQDADGDGIIDAIDVDVTGGEDTNKNGIDDDYEAINNDDTDCASITDATLLVGKAAFKPPICTAPVRTYWHRYNN